MHTAPRLSNRSEMTVFFLDIQEAMNQLRPESFSSADPIPRFHEHSDWFPKSRDGHYRDVTRRNIEKLCDESRDADASR